VRLLARFRELWAICFLFLVVVPAAAGEEVRSWAPLDPQELKMTEFTPLPGAEAVLLFFANEIDDVSHKEFFYSRIKILTDGGKRFATVEFPLVAKTSLADFYARTIHPDGSITEFVGQPYDKVVVKARGVRLRVQSFTLPQVTVGSIIEYRYELHYGDKNLRHHEWTVQHDLYALKERFSLRYDKHYSVRWLPTQGFTKSPENDLKAGILRMEAENIAPFEPEDQMPPEDSYKVRVRLFYTSAFMSFPSAYWYQVGRWWSEAIDYYIGNHKEIKAAADAAIGGETDPERRLRKLYERAQQIRNLTYERHRTQQEHKQEDLKTNKNVLDVLKHGYGDRNEITRLFVALARSAGFTASVVFVSSREERLFDREVLSFSQLDSEVASVWVNGKAIFLDPGTRFCPYRLMRWMRTGTAAMDMRDPGNLIPTPGAGHEAALISRSADLRLTSDGAIKGEVHIEFSGADALERRLAALDTDEAGRKKELEDELKQWLPANAKVNMTASSGWEDEHGAITAIFNIEVPEFASVAGKRLLIPAVLFQPKKSRVFKKGPRKYPVYYHYAFTEQDQISIAVPEGYAVESAAAPQNVKAQFGSYTSTFSSPTPTRLNMERSLLFDGVFFQPGRYEELRDFFAKVQSADDSQSVLRQAQIAGSGKTN
jgi:Domain of Unknown Function with PDB structure (DUF3857)/Transglutaminase-like superfamily